MATFHRYLSRWFELDVSNLGAGPKGNVFIDKFRGTFALRALVKFLHKCCRNYTMSFANSTAL